MKHKYKLIKEDQVNFPSKKELDKQMDFDRILVGYHNELLTSGIQNTQTLNSGLKILATAAILTSVLIGYVMLEESEDRISPAKVLVAEATPNEPVIEERLTEVIKAAVEPVAMEVTTEAGPVENPKRTAKTIIEIEETDARPDTEDEVTANPVKVVFEYDYVTAEPVVGFDSLYAFIGKTLVYPHEEIELGRQGTVLVQFQVDPDGNTTQTRILKGLGSAFDEEVSRVMEAMPAWKPATLNGDAVASILRLPVTFQLDGSRKDFGYKFIRASPVTGFPALYEYFRRELDYPQQMLEDSTEAVVMVQFDVTLRGDVENITVVDGGARPFEKEALRVIRRMPYWRPAYLNGKPVHSTSLLPISFKLGL